MDEIGSGANNSVYKKKLCLSNSDMETVAIRIGPAGRKRERKLGGRIFRSSDLCNLVVLFNIQLNQNNKKLIKDAYFGTLFEYYFASASRSGLVYII